MAHSIVMPSMGMFTAEGTLIRWLFPAGAVVASGQPVAEIETEKAVLEIQAPASGILHPVSEVGAKITIEGLLGYILSPGEAPPKQAKVVSSTVVAGTGASNESQEPRSVPPAPEDLKREVRVSPLARRLAAEHAIDFSRITGTGPGGRIVETDILSAIEERKPERTSHGAHPARRIRQRIPLAGIRRATTARLRQNRDNAIPLTITREVRADALVSARQRLENILGDTIPYDALFIKLLAAGLRERPELNATIEDDVILLLDEIHIGFAVAVTDGVLVPVIRNADKTPLADVAAAVLRFSQTALSGKLKVGDMDGGTATISNLGAHGVDAFTPVLNPPQSAILGIGRIMERPVVLKGRIEPLMTCVLSLTFDHRVTDGAPAARLLDVIACLMTSEHYLDAFCEAR